MMDKANLADILAGNYIDSDGKTKSLDDLMLHPHVQMAKLERHHVLALRLYTTESYRKINDPLRSDPPVRPHPFAATTYFVSEGIKKLRAVSAQLPDAHECRVFWRGMKDLGLDSAAFLEKGGTDFGCVSTSANESVAVHNFAAGSLPMVFRVVSKGAMDRGADISFLSVFPSEEEYVYPPLTYLRATKIKMEKICGVKLLVATVEPTMS
jgi:hypothetical protein